MLCVVVVFQPDKLITQVFHQWLQQQAWNLGLLCLLPAALAPAQQAGDLLAELNVLTRCDCTTRNERKAARLARRMDERNIPTVSGKGKWRGPAIAAGVLLPIGAVVYWLAFAGGRAPTPSPVVDPTATEAPVEDLSPLDRGWALVRSGSVEGTRMFALGGRAFTKSLADRLDIGFEEAERVKIAHAGGEELEDGEEVAHIIGADIAVWAAGVELADMVEPLAGFKGVSRRFQSIGTVGGVEVIDDFAHNPDKIAAALGAARDRLADTGGRVLAVFQPHGFGPTRFLRDDLVVAFAEHLRPDDVLWLPEIFYAGGSVERDISSADLAADIAARGRHARFLADRGELFGFLAGLGYDLEDFEAEGEEGRRYAQASIIASALE